MITVVQDRMGWFYRADPDGTFTCLSGDEPVTLPVVTLVRDGELLPDTGASRFAQLAALGLARRTDHSGEVQS